MDAIDLHLHIANLLKLYSKLDLQRKQSNVEFALRSSRHWLTKFQAFKEDPMALDDAIERTENEVTELLTELKVFQLCVQLATK